MLSPHVQDAITYAMATADGKRVAGRLEILACQRFLDDLERDDLIFDAEAAHRVCSFVEGLKHVKGELAGKPLKLEPWQKFIYVNVFGFKRISDNTRRYRRVYVECSRKQGKSSLSAPVALYMLCADGEEGSEVYTAATTRDQAKIVYEIATQMVRRDPEFRKYFGVDIGQSAILPLAVTQRLTGSKMAALSAQGNTLDGLNPHCAIVDELHAHTSSAVYDVLASALGARRQPLLWAITTAGFDQAGVCYSQRSFVEEILNGVSEDDSTFGIIYTLDKDDDWADEKNWPKSNPNLGVSITLDYLRDECTQALSKPLARNNFLTKHMNIWTNAATAWVDMRKWDECKTPGIQMADYAAWPCYVGIDISTRRDITAVMAVFVNEDESQFAVFGKYFLPEEGIRQQSLKHWHRYQAWAEEGLLELTPGNVVDQSCVEEYVSWLHSNFDVVSCGYDPWNSTNLAVRLHEQDVPMVEVRQTVQQLSEPAKFFDEIILERKIVHNDPILTWMVSNTVVTHDTAGNIRPKKEKGKEEDKIDGVIGTVIALNRFLAERAEPFPYDNRDLMVLSF